MKQITIQRKYLYEFFDDNLLKISNYDGLPFLKLIVLTNLTLNGIRAEFQGNIVHFINVGDLIQQDTYKMMKDNPELNLDQIMKRTQALVKQTIHQGKERRVMAPISEPKEAKIKIFDPYLASILNSVVGSHLTKIHDEFKKAGDEDWNPKHKLERDLQSIQDYVHAVESLGKNEQDKFFKKYPKLPQENTINEEDYLDPRWKDFKDYYLNKLNDELIKTKDENWKKNEIFDYAYQKFNEIYYKEGNLLEKKEEAQKFYRKLPRKFKKFVKILPKR